MELISSRGVVRESPLRSNELPSSKSSRDLLIQLGSFSIWVSAKGAQPTESIDKSNTACMDSWQQGRAAARGLTLPRPIKVSLNLTAPRSNSSRCLIAPAEAAISSRNSGRLYNGCRIKAQPCGLRRTEAFVMFSRRDRRDGPGYHHRPQDLRGIFLN